MARRVMKINKHMDNYGPGIRVRTEAATQSDVEVEVVFQNELQSVKNELQPIEQHPMKPVKYEAPQDNVRQGNIFEQMNMVLKNGFEASRYAGHPLDVNSETISRWPMNQRKIDELCSWNLEAQKSVVSAKALGQTLHEQKFDERSRQISSSHRLQSQYLRRQRLQRWWFQKHSTDAKKGTQFHTSCCPLPSSSTSMPGTRVSEKPKDDVRREVVATATASMSTVILLPDQGSVTVNINPNFTSK